MALIKCKECEAEISDEAKACPKCGAPVPKGTSTSTVVLGGLFVLVVGSCVFKGADAPSGSPAVASAPVVDEAKEKRFRGVVGGARWLRDNSKNPKSFELNRAFMPDAQTVCYEYRGTNSFNAVVPGRHVIGDTINSGAAKDWNKHCAGKTGEDFTYARRAM